MLPSSEVDIIDDQCQRDVTLPNDDIPWWRDGGVPLAIVLSVAFLLHAAYAIEFVSRHPLADRLVSDAALYHDWAASIATGDLAGNTEPYHHPPLYPYVIGMVYAIFGPSPTAIIALQVLMGTATLYLLYRLVNRAASPRVALAAVVVTTLYLPFPFFQTRLLPATLATLLATAALLVATTPRPSRTSLFACGMLFGLLAAARPNQLVAAALVMAFLVWRLWRDHAPGKVSPRAGGGLLVLGLALPITPFFLHNAIHAGEPILLCDTGGINLYFAHHADSGASFRTRNLAFADVAQQAIVSKQIAQGAEKDHLTWREVSNHFARRAGEYAIHNPGAEISLLGRKLLAFVRNYEYGIIYSPEGERGLLATSRIFWIPAGLILAGALIGAILVGTSSPASTVGLLFVAAQAITVLLFFQYSRFRLVAVPALLLLAATVASERARNASSRRRAAALIGGGALLATSFAPLDQEAIDQRAIAHVSIAEGFRAKGDLDAARRWNDRALAAAPRMMRGILERFAILKAEGEIVPAKAWLEEYLEDDDGNPLLQAELARFLVEQPSLRDLPRAIALGQRAMETAPTLVEARLALGMAFLFSGDAEAAAEACEPALNLSTATGELFLIAGTARQQLDSHDYRALQSLLEAQRRLPNDARPIAQLILLMEANGDPSEVRGLRNELRRIAPDHRLLKGQPR